MEPRPALELLRADAFHIEIDGISTGGFVSCTGLGACVGVLEYPEGGAAWTRKFRGDETWSNIVLARGVMRRQELLSWYERGDRRDGAIVLVSPLGKELSRWEFRRGWPCRWEGPSLHAASAEVALELLEVAHEGVRWAAR